MNDKYGAVLEVVKSNSPAHIDVVFKKVWEAKIYSSKFAISKALQFLHRTKRIKIDNFRVEVGDNE